jgi:hypothetical protein
MLSCLLQIRCISEGASWEGTRGRPVATGNMKRGQTPGVSLAYYRPVLEGSLAEEAKQEKKHIRITASEHAHNTATSRVENALRRTLSDPTCTPPKQSQSNRAEPQGSSRTQLADLFDAESISASA